MLQEKKAIYLIFINLIFLPASIYYGRLPSSNLIIYNVIYASTTIAQIGSFHNKYGVITIPGYAGLLPINEVPKAPRSFPVC